MIAVAAYGCEQKIRDRVRDPAAPHNFELFCN